jgi:hypothetical protein
MGWAESGVSIYDYLSCDTVTHATNRIFSMALYSQQWKKFVETRSDPWAFPTDEPNTRSLLMYSVFNGDAVGLMKDKEFIYMHRRGIRLLALSWGWDLYKQTVRSSYWIATSPSINQYILFVN